MFLPAEYPIIWSGSEGNANWTFAVVIGFTCCAILYWFSYAKYHFRGPSKGSNDIHQQRDTIPDFDTIKDDKPLSFVFNEISNDSATFNAIIHQDQVLV